MFGNPSMDIRLPDTEYLAFSFSDQKWASHYYKFLVLPFGLGVTPCIFSKLTRPLIAEWRRKERKLPCFLMMGLVE